MTVIFCDPPSPRGPGKYGAKYDWHAIANALKSRPGEWALLGSFSTGICSRVMTGGYKAFDGGQWEFTTRSKPGTTDRDLYGIYLGEAEEPDEEASVLLTAKQACSCTCKGCQR